MEDTGVVSIRRTTSGAGPQLFDAATGTAVQVLEGHTAQVNQIAFAPDGRTARTVSDDGTARIWDLSALAR